MFSSKFFIRNKIFLNTVFNAKSPNFNLNFKPTINTRYSFLTKINISPVLTSQKSFGGSSGSLKSLFIKFSTGTAIQSEKIVGYWLLGCSGMVAVAIILGGVTRLTESGLSMVTWRLLGEKIPANKNDWLMEFKRYQQYPEYKLLKRDITLEEFKKIWWMEYIHRTWGRLIGAAFYLPAAFFWLKGYLPPGYKTRVGAFGVLIAMQGLMGWYMVKSGLEDRFHKETDVPRVSQYRLAAHLSLALLLYAGTFYSALEILFPVHSVAVKFSVKNLRRIAYGSNALIFLTAISGAFVAGMDAGLVYNSFPKMGERWIPEDILSLSPIQKNFTENPVTVQFEHRLLGATTFTTIVALWLLSGTRPLPARTRMAVNALAYMSLVQVTLGISTLLHFVPVSIASIHQSGSVLLLSIAMWLTHNLKCLKYLSK